MANSDTDYQDNEVAEPGAGFYSKGLGLSIQKKLLGKMSSKKIAKQFIDDDTSCVLDHAYEIMKEHAQHKKDAEKILKYIIKTIIKVGILYRNDQFNSEELRTTKTFKSKFRSLAMTICRFHEVDSTFDIKFLRTSIEECRQLLQSLIGRHSKDKSKSRVDTVFDFFTSQELMGVLFASDGKYRDHMDVIVTRMHKMMDEGNVK